MSTHAEVMAETLVARGVEYVFGLPGGEILAFVDACRRAGLRFLLTGHEASAAWMAQVMGQITGIPGVCAATLGPGATNLVTGVANAWLDRAPLLAVTAQIPNAKIQTLTHQRLPLTALFSPITKGSLSIGEGDTAELMNTSLELAALPRAGPVHLSLASDVALQQCASAPTTRQATADPIANDTQVRQIAAQVNAAERPLVLIGLGATPAMAPAIGQLINSLQSPFLLTAKAKGMVREDHPLFLGVASGMAIDRDIVETIRSADVILAIGFDPVECDKTWFADAGVVAVDVVTMAEGDYRPLEAIGDMVSLLALLSANIAAPKPWPSELLETRRRAIRREPAITKEGLSPLRLIQELRSMFPRDGIATCDVGSHKLLMGQFWRTYEPGTFFMSNGLSGMGFGIPAAIGAQLAHPEKSVIAIVGDGGMLMMMHDLVLIRELGLPILIVVLVDRSLSLIRVGAERRGLPAYGVDFTPPDFARAAEAFGIASCRAGCIADVRACVEDALTRRVPMLVELPINYREYYELV
ncbi:MAG: thiamine pyrophosphate-binding protein [Bryobacteraceae bacterium]